MKRTSLTVVVFSLIAVGLTAASRADGLIKKLPPTGHWSSYNVVTSIKLPNGTQTDSTGILTVRALGSIEIDGKRCRWLEFEHSWEQDPTEKVPRRFHSSIERIAIDESVFANNSDPLKEILAGVGAKTSADEKPEKWQYPRPHDLRPGLGSASGFGVLDNYLRLPFHHSVDLGSQRIDVGDVTLDCIGIETSESNHTIGADRNNVSSTAYRQWACNETEFGVAKYEFERIQLDGTSFSQELTLKESGDNAETSLPPSE